MAEAVSIQAPKRGRKPTTARVPEGIYAGRDYERSLTESGRRFISVDIDSGLLEQLDAERGKVRRGIFLEQLLRDRLVPSRETSMR